MEDRVLQGQLKNRHKSREKQRLFLRLATGALTKKKSRLAIALISIIIGAAVTSGMSSVYLDILNKMSRELRSYGANLVVLPDSGSQSKSFSEAKFKAALSKIPPGELIGAAAYLYNIADVISGSKVQRLVVTGVNFEEAKKVSPYWKVGGELPRDGKSALVGTEVAEKLKLNPGDEISIRQAAKTTAATKPIETPVTPCTSCHKDVSEPHKKLSMRWADLEQCATCHQPHPLDIFDNDIPAFKVAGIVTTGGVEDGQIFISLEKAQTLFDHRREISAGYLSIVGQTGKIQNIANQIKNSGNDLSPRLIKRISESEGRVLLKIRSLIYPIVVAILLSTALCVAITTVAMTLERRREIGLKKALGAEDRDIVLEFLSEAIVLGLVGGIVGWAAGIFFAQWIGKTIFESAIAFKPATIPLTLTVSLLITGLGSFAPVRIATKIKPAIVLKEE